jgi:hypothetical protein
VSKLNSDTRARDRARDFGRRGRTERERCIPTRHPFTKRSKARGDQNRSDPGRTTQTQTTLEDSTLSLQVYGAQRLSFPPTCAFVPTCTHHSKPTRGSNKYGYPKAKCSTPIVDGPRPLRNMDGGRKKERPEPTCMKCQCRFFAAFHPLT